MSDQVKRVLLPLLQLASTKTKRQPRKPFAKHTEQDLSKLNKFQLAQCRAIEDMRYLVHHVIVLMDHPAPKAKEVVKWLNDVGFALDEMDHYVYDGYFERESQDGSLNIDTDGICTLQNVLIFSIDELSESDIDNDALLDRLMMFWINEVINRGVELVNLMIGAIPVLDAKNAFDAMNAVRYPSHVASIDI